MDSVAISSLLESARWSDFMKCVAVGLHVNLTLVVNDTVYCNHTLGICLNCNRAYTNLIEEDMGLVLSMCKDGASSHELIRGDGGYAILLKLYNNVYIVVHGCTCLSESDYPLFKQRAYSAQKLLSSFLSTLSGEMLVGEQTVELSTLRQINHIILAMFHGSGSTLESALDLILSALVIILDAKGSWLEYKIGDEFHLLMKGDKKLVEACLGDSALQPIAVELHNGTVHGRLGVVLPENIKRASALLSSMAQECLIVFEIEHLLQLMESRLTGVLNSIGSAVLLFDEHSIVCYMNSTAERLLSNSSLDLIGQQADKIDSPWSSLVAQKIRHNVSGTNNKFQSNGREYWLDWQVSPILEGSGTSGWLVIADDRTDYHKWLEIGRKAERMASTVNMVGSLAHELANPISSVRDLVKLTVQMKDPKKILGYNNMILRQIDHVTSLLNEFLLLARPAQISAEPLNLKDLLNGLMPLMLRESAGTGVQIMPDLQEVPQILGDSGQLTQVVLNLVRNGIEAVGQNGSVTISLRNKSDWVEVSFIDSGAGIPYNIMDKLFEPFFTTKERGTGLGLPIVQAIVNNHGGSITASNSPIGGAVFKVLFPEIKPVEGTQSILDVMVVAVDDIIRTSIDQVLHIACIQTHSTRDLASALSLVEFYKPDILMLEKSFISKNSTGYVRKVWPETKLLVLGELDSEVDIEGAEYISLPLDYSKLISKIRSMTKK